MSRFAINARGDGLDGVDSSCWSVVLLKPDCVRRLLNDHVLDQLSEVADIRATRRVMVADWQVFVHNWDLLVDADCFDVDAPMCLRSAYVGRPVIVALAHGARGTPERLRSLLGHFDPAGPLTARSGAISASTASRDFLYRSERLRPRIEQLRAQQSRTQRSPTASVPPAEDVNSTVRTLTLKVAQERE